MLTILKTIFRKLLKSFPILAILGILGNNSSYGQSISLQSIRDITRTSAQVSINLVSTGANVAIYYGRGNYLTNASAWDSKLNLGILSTGLYTNVLNNLTPASLYYLNIRAVEGNMVYWGSVSNFSTLASVSSNLPDTNGYGFVQVNSNGDAITPLNSIKVGTGTLSAPGDELLFNNIPVGSGSYHYPVFQIPLASYWTDWADFELKATTNNFTSGSLETGLLLMVESLGTNSIWWTNAWVSTNSQIFYVPCNNGTNDPRPVAQWDGLGIFSEQTGAATNADLTPQFVIVCMAPFVQGSPGVTQEWLRADNPHISFVYHRRSAFNSETNADGSGNWISIRPTEWRLKPIQLIP
jgi:hypothetical protein